MKYAVIYARYSSERQNDQSIEGQLRICNKYAEDNGLTILDTYIDRAMTGTNDQRAAFQQMLSDCEKHGVKNEIKSLQNWMSHNREKFMAKDRDKIEEEGKKKRHATISWHGLRHGYAQKTHEEALKDNPRQAQKIVSENLGHHRYKVTRIYLAEENPKKKAQ